jgi:dihydrodipicolinate synthase/N-acetylneuraminate lyase
MNQWATAVTVLSAVKEVADGRVPVLSGVAENTTALTASFARPW